MLLLDFAVACHAAIGHVNADCPRRPGGGWMRSRRAYLALKRPGNNPAAQELSAFISKKKRVISTQPEYYRVIIGGR